MNVQQHARTTRIKLLSRYLYLCLTGIYYLFWILFPLAIILVFVGLEDASFTVWGFGSFQNADLSFIGRVMLAIAISFSALLLLKLTHHFRELIRLFAKGEIFNQKAIEHARKGLLVALVIYGISLLTALGNLIYSFTQQTSGRFTFSSDFITVFLVFGLMYVLLWALEIGADLNDESELTI